VARRRKTAIRPDMSGVKLILAIIAVMAGILSAAARDIPLPPPRPATATPSPEGQVAAPEEPSACQIRLSAGIAAFRPQPPIVGPGECGGSDLLLLDGIVLPDKARVAVVPPATLRCAMAEALVHWVRDDVAPAAAALGASLRAVENYASYECRGRNRVVGAKLSEHGRANALDIRSITLADGRVVALTDLAVAQNFRDQLRRSACARFTTVLGPGSDGAHESHVHVDLIERRGGFRMCQWDFEGKPKPDQVAEAEIPLPRPRPFSRLDAPRARSGKHP
jgi:hypothetical protein